MRFAAAVLALTACTGPELATRESALTEAERRERFRLIRDSAAEMGLNNAALLGGIATTETELAHCWAEATFACMGPVSPSCGGPVIAGAADGPCSAQQGGLGMFQFDAGTYAQTVDTYGEAVLTVEGNTAQAVAFVVDKVILDVDGVTDWSTAVAWLDRVPLVAGEALTEEWASLIACRYNGCCAATTGCRTRAKEYRDNAIALQTTLGAEFWRTADRCAAIPEGGVIDQRTACYVAAGEPRFWRRETGGVDGNHEWTNSTDAAKPASFAQWLLRPVRATTYRIEAHVQRGEATAAKYTVFHAGVTDIITIDQRAADGYVTLGEFELTGDGTEHVQLGDNTGTDGQKVVFDALRVRAVDGKDPAGNEVDSGCSTTSTPGTGALAAAVGAVVVGLLVGLAPARRRRRLA